MQKWARPSPCPPGAQVLAVLCVWNELFPTEERGVVPERNLGAGQDWDNVSCWLPEAGAGRTRVTASGARGSLRGGENVVELDRGGSCTACGCAQCHSLNCTLHNG